MVTGWPYAAENASAAAIISGPMPTVATPDPRAPMSRIDEQSEAACAGVEPSTAAVRPLARSVAAASARDSPWLRMSGPVVGGERAGCGR